MNAAGRNAHLEDLKALAREKRELYKVNTAAFGLTQIRKIYKSEGIKIDYRKLPHRIKGLYMCSDGDYSVAIQKSLPMEPKIFALIHELKHHYRDQEILSSGEIKCGDFNKNDLIEIGAEVFAAEFIYPEAEFKKDIATMNIKEWSAENIVKLKRACKAKVSYQYLRKRLEHLKLINKDEFKDIQFQKLEDKLYGAPYHRRFVRK